MPDGFNGRAVGESEWHVRFEDGNACYVWAQSETIAVQRVMAKYPNKRIRSIEKR